MDSFLFWPGSELRFEVGVDVGNTTSGPEVRLERECFQCEHGQFGDYPQGHLEFLPVLIYPAPSCRMPMNRDSSLAGMLY